MSETDHAAATPQPRGEKRDATQMELVGRVVYSLLLPSVRVARAFHTPLKELTDWVQLAYLKELMDQGLKLKEAAEVLQVSVRKISSLSSQLREDFFAPERDYELTTRIEFALWAEPLSRARLKQYLSDEDEEALDEALDRLVEEGRVLPQEGRSTMYSVTRPASRLVRDELLARIDGLNGLLAILTDTVSGRFFRNDSKTFARMVQLRLRAEDLPKLRALYEEQIWPALEELDAAARDDPHAIPMGAGLFWAPQDLINTVGSTDTHMTGDE